MLPHYLGESPDYRYETESGVFIVTVFGRDDCGNREIISRYAICPKVYFAIIASMEGAVRQYLGCGGDSEDNVIPMRKG